MWLVGNLTAIKVGSGQSSYRNSTASPRRLLPACKVPQFWENRLHNPERVSLMLFFMVAEVARFLVFVVRDQRPVFAGGG